MEARVRLCYAAAAGIKRPAFERCGCRQARVVSPVCTRGDKESNLEVLFVGGLFMIGMRLFVAHARHCAVGTAASAGSFAFLAVADLPTGNQCNHSQQQYGNEYRTDVFRNPVGHDQCFLSN